MHSVAIGTGAIKAFVLQVRDHEMRVCDYHTLRELRVHTREADSFSAGDRIQIEYSRTGTRGSSTSSSFEGLSIHYTSISQRG